MKESLYFEGSETFYADVESENAEDEILANASWVSQRQGQAYPLNSNSLKRFYIDNTSPQQPTSPIGCFYFIGVFILQEFK